MFLKNTFRGRFHIRKLKALRSNTLKNSERIKCTLYNSKVTEEWPGVLPVNHWSLFYYCKVYLSLQSVFDLLNLGFMKPGHFWEKVYLTWECIWPPTVKPASGKFKFLHFAKIFFHFFYGKVLRRIQLTKRQRQHPKRNFPVIFSTPFTKWLIAPSVVSW